MVTNGRASKEREVTSGTPQGACLSPLFFGLYISPVVTLLNTYSKEEAQNQGGMKEKEKKNTWATLFADD